MIRFSFLLIAIACLAGCGSDVYVRNGQVVGNTFHIPPAALSDQDPQVQSWIAYSLARSTCQVSLGGAVPSRDHSYDCEFRARRILATRWLELAAYTKHRDAYLDSLAGVYDAGMLNEYVWTYFHRSDWVKPDNLDLDAFESWRRTALRGHEPRTRQVGYWALVAR